MSNALQEGIYYRSRDIIGNSFCIVSLKADNVTLISELGITIGKIWNKLTKLKNGVIMDLDVDPQHRKNGNLSVLIAYGPELFKIQGSKKNSPMNFGDTSNFKPPQCDGGGLIVEGSGLSYSKEIASNHLLTDHILLQFIADNEFFTNRAVIELWKEIHRSQKNDGKMSLRINGFYTGFQRADHRNWFGFHDGLSNLKSQERPYVILINSRYLNPRDQWTLNGTYLAFIRIAMDLEKWEDTSVPQQEILIGRDKLTGCPLISVDKKGRPLKDSRCPVPGTSEVIDRGNEYYREHPPYERGNKDQILKYSHIGRTRPIDRVQIWDKKSLRIYRQGFEFLSTARDNSTLIPGLNFVSFQNTPQRLFNALTYQNEINQKDPSSIPNLNRFMSVLAAGIFFVAPKSQGEPFPGAGIFFNNKELRNVSIDQL